MCLLAAPAGAQQPTQHYSAPPASAGSFGVQGGGYLVHPGHSAAVAAAGAAERSRSTEMLRQFCALRPGAMAAQYQHVRSLPGCALVRQPG